MEQVQWEGRLEVISEAPMVVLDCAHNVASVSKMTAELRKNHDFSRCLVVLGLMKEKKLTKSSKF
ncbi:MAG: hypothetical protein CM1200mP16_04440 [Nitrospina sp.]|nr:MAG: hypothetical protein CM1200mP16_04440 [Nitrospina sp.]